MLKIGHLTLFHSTTYFGVEGILKSSIFIPHFCQIPRGLFLWFLSPDPCPGSRLYAVHFGQHIVVALRQRKQNKHTAVKLLPPVCYWCLSLAHHSGLFSFPKI